MNYNLESVEYKRGITIIICFYNAQERLESTLNYIKNLSDRNQSNTELILVNNASTDNSEEVIKTVMGDFSTFSWKIVYENEPGLANARICGYKNATFDLIVFCDDDNWLEKEYLNKADTIFSNYPQLGILGGKGEAVSSVEIPVWFEANQNYYAVGPQMSKKGRVIGERNVVYGAGLVIKTDILTEMFRKGFSFQSQGRTGKKLSAGEDSEMCIAVQIMGYHIYYDDTLHFYHFIEPKRLTEEYFERLKNGMSVSSFYGRFYRDYFLGRKMEVSSNFWVKEFIYTFLDLFKCWSKGRFNTSRHFSLMKFLLSERSKYDEQVKNILTICNQLSK